MTSAGYVRREATISAAINAVLSAGFFFAFFGLRDVTMWSAPGFVIDFIPQGFMVGLMAALVPGLLARRTAVLASLALDPRGITACGVALVALSTGYLAAIGGTAAAVAIATATGWQVVPFAAAITIKVLFGGCLGAAVTALTLKRQLR
ncbi:MAG: hypothetical protein J7498_06065 [Sphingobium sp.]|nr:hypothetical protein [Sphingobium sp.]